MLRAPQVPQQGPVDVSTPIKVPTSRRNESCDDDDDNNNNSHSRVDVDGDNGITSIMRTYPVSASGLVTSPVAVHVWTPSTPTEELSGDAHDDGCGPTSARTLVTPADARERASAGCDRAAIPTTAFSPERDSHDTTVDFSLSISPRTP